MIKVLHVDDDKNSLEITKWNLDKISDKLDIIWSTSAKDALDVLEVENVDCILCDFQMPGTDGLGLLKELRETQRETPFILLTGVHSTQTESSAAEAGVDGYFTKESNPDNYKKLLASINQVVREAKENK